MLWVHCDHEFLRYSNTRLFKWYLDFHFWYCKPRVHLSLSLVFLSSFAVITCRVLWDADALIAVCAVLPTQLLVMRSNCTLFYIFTVLSICFTGYNFLIKYWMCWSCYYAGQKVAVCQWKSAHAPSLAHTATRLVAYKELSFSLIQKQDIFQTDVIEAFLDTASSCPTFEFMRYLCLKASSMQPSADFI